MNVKSKVLLAIGCGLLILAGGIVAGLAIAGAGGAAIAGSGVGIGGFLVGLFLKRQNPDGSGLGKNAGDDLATVQGRLAEALARRSELERDLQGFERRVSETEKLNGQLAAQYQGLLGEVGELIRGTDGLAERFSDLGKRVAESESSGHSISGILDQSVPSDTNPEQISGG